MQNRRFYARARRARQILTLPSRRPGQGALPLHPGGSAQGALPLDPARVLHPRAPTLLRDANKTLPCGKRNLRASVPEHDAHSFGDVFKPDENFSETVSRAAHPSVHRRCNRRLNAAAFRGPRRKYFRWGKAMRPRKPDGKLNRHGLGARRVALLAPRGVLSKYRYPLSYVSAITKIFGKAQK